MLQPPAFVAIKTDQAGDVVFLGLALQFGVFPFPENFGRNT